MWVMYFIFIASQMNEMAAKGKYEGEVAGGAAAQSLYVANHQY